MFLRNEAKKAMVEAWRGVMTSTKLIVWTEWCSGKVVESQAVAPGSTPAVTTFRFSETLEARLPAGSTFEFVLAAGLIGIDATTIPLCQHPYQQVYPRPP